LEGGSAFLEIPEEIRYDDTESIPRGTLRADFSRDTEVIHMDSGGFEALFHSTLSDRLPPSPIQLAKIGQALQAAPEDGDIPERVLYLLSLLASSADIRAHCESSPLLLYVDHESLLASVPRNRGETYELAEGRVMVTLDNRRILGFLGGFHRLHITADISVIRYVCIPEHEEDKRFLFEHSKGSMYT
jgi:hypothetical protein